MALLKTQKIPEFCDTLLLEVLMVYCSEKAMKKY